MSRQRTFHISGSSISSIRFGDYLNSIPLPAILAVFRAEELDNYGLLTVDSNLIYSIVDVLLGGRRGTAALRIEGRPYTTIERVLVQRMVEVVLADAHVHLEVLDASGEHSMLIIDRGPIHLHLQVQRPRVIEFDGAEHITQHRPPLLPQECQ